ncbi:MAG: hypothetical protein LKE39_04750 [Sphaerochaeta sp.]|jgi:hypothetical protein|nr:hypothetical protein [Sphaerochaeta sp.]MCH3919777.1 hypothetical protein [Sphaerochaeta sp.]MCI2045431.1 hypothetical protein [Sphaerochaeta sp.]MCI2076759.1 hypothetical protein [Sphaerochaeta sp.]MCI2096660.1 hypothetical protein [Sphaerochaeta sp.]
MVKRGHQVRIATISVAVAFILYLIIGLLDGPTGLLPFLVCYAVCYLITSVIIRRNDDSGND